MPPHGAALRQYAIRTDSHFMDYREIFEGDNYSGWCVREDPGDNEHWHWFIETKLKADSIRQEIRRKLPEVRGNGAYSVAEVRDVDKYLRYMAKGEQEGIVCEVYWSKGPLWSDEKILELHEAYWTEAAKLKKRKAGSMADAVIDICKEKRVEWDDRRTIAKEYIKELVRQHKPINLYSVKSNVNLVQVALCPTDDAIDELAQQVHL